MTKEITKLEGSLEDKIVSLITWLDHNLTKKHWDDDDYMRRFGNRSAQQIINDGDTGYMGSCHDYTIVALYILGRNNIETEFVVETL